MAKVTSVSFKGEEHGENEGYVAGRYSHLESLRFNHLLRARDCAKITIPMLMPPAGHSSATKFTTPYQSVGARGVNNLASKLLLALLPMNTAFFKLQVDDAILEQFGGSRGEVELTLASIERTIIADINGSSTRVAAFEALKQLVVSGNVLLNLPKEGGMRVFRLDRYVVKRDPMGNPLDIIIKEELAPSVLEEEVRVACDVPSPEENSDEKTVELYTHVERSQEDGGWEVYQEINGVEVPASRGTYPLDKCPWMALRLITVDGEDYGRSYVEEYLGDLKSLEGLSKAVLEGSVAMAKMVWLVNPNGTTNKKTISAASNNAVTEGNAADVTVLQANKFGDFRVAQETAKEITSRLASAFLLNSSIQRNGDRVTAEEIRYMASELEDALGGIYSVLTQEFLLPLLQREMVRMAKAKRIPSLPKGVVKPVIITGIEAIGNNQELEKLDMFTRDIMSLGQGAIAMLNMDELLKRRAALAGIDVKGLIKSPDDLKAEQQQAQMMQLAQAATPNAVKGISDNINQRQEQSAPPPQEGMM